MIDAQPCLSAPETSRESVQPPASRAAAGSAGFGVLAAFTVTSFLSAFLLFSIQPLFAKMALPVLGGAPSVWAVALCFFQGALLAGYCYAHGLTRFVSMRTTGFAHLALCAAGALVLPIAIPSGWGEPPPGDPYLWQLGLFTVAVGLPFAAVAANAPLLQAWFAATGHSHGRDPYFLYAASNLGSLLALLSYPFALEPLLGLRAMSLAWTFGFAALAVALALCFWLVWRAPGGSGVEPKAGAAGDAAVSWRGRAAWVGLAFVPSGLLTAFTAHISTDVASAPLLWVIPLSLYLLTFVLVFRARPLIPPRVLLAVHLAAIVSALLFLAQTKWDKWLQTSIVGAVAFAVSALVAHRALYEARPAASRLTEFYLWMAFGGVLGGLFSALAAPWLFSEIYEYPILLALSMACRPGAARLPRSQMEFAAVAGSLMVGGVVLWEASRGVARFGLDPGAWGLTIYVAAIFGALTLAAWRSPILQFAMAATMCLAVVVSPSAVKRGEARRSYFGVYRVALSPDGEFNVLTHGTTLHGAQRVRDADGNEVADITPGTYYYPGSPMAKAIGIARGRLAAEEGRVGRYGVVGLGSGSLACLSKPGERWRFFEIDPVVVAISTSSGYFTYLDNCQPKPDIVLGDARLTIAKEPDASYDLIVVDAFTSDAIPVHLMTVEAVRLYLSKLGDKGVAVLHISNRYLDLDRVLGAELDLLPGVHGLLVSDDAAIGTYDQTTSTVAVFSKNAEALDSFRALPGASDFERGKLSPWTDDSSDILGPLLSRMRN